MSDVIKSPRIRRLEIIEITVFSAPSHTAHLSVFTMEAENSSQKLTIDFMFHCYEWNLSSMNTCCHAKYATNFKGRTGF